MKKLITALLTVMALGIGGVATADSIANVYTCELKDDVEIEDVQAQNSTWLKWVNEHVEGGGSPAPSAPQLSAIRTSSYSSIPIRACPRGQLHKRH